jgi:hypothetical protein
MQELNFSTGPALKVVVDGNEYAVKKPTVGQVRKLEQAQKNGADYDAVLECLDACGMPKAVAEGLQLEQLTALMEALVPASKKKE